MTTCKVCQRRKEREKRFVERMNTDKPRTRFQRRQDEYRTRMDEYEAYLSAFVDEELKKT